MAVTLPTPLPPPLISVNHTLPHHKLSNSISNGKGEYPPAAWEPSDSDDQLLPERLLWRDGKGESPMPPVPGRPPPTGWAASSSLNGLGGDSGSTPPSSRTPSTNSSIVCDEGVDGAPPTASLTKADDDPPDVSDALSIATAISPSGSGGGTYA